MISNEKLKELRRKAHGIRPTVQIGKQGLTDETIKEIRKQLKTNKLLKIKMLRPAMEGTTKQDLINSILEETRTALVSKTGLTVTIYKTKAYR